MQSSIFDLYTPQQLREMYFETWESDYHEWLNNEVGRELLYELEDANIEKLKRLQMQVIEEATYGYEDDYGYTLKEFDKQVEYTANGPQLLLFPIE